MNFDRRDGYCLKRIKDRHRRVSIRAGVNNDAVSTVEECSLNEVHQIAFVIALKTFDLDVLLLEAVARGALIVASDCPGNRDVLKGYPRASLFPTGDVGKLAALLSATEDVTEK